MNVNRILFDLVKKQNWEEIREILIKKDNKNNINNDIDVNIRDDSGNYILTYAVLFNKIDIVELLVDRGAKLDITDNDNRSVLYIAIKYGYSDMLRLLLDLNKTSIGISIVDIQDVNGNTPLHYAIGSKNIDMCRMLIEHGESNVNVKDNNGNTSLHLAVYSRDIDLCKLIIDNNGKIDSKNNTGESALHMACNIEKDDIVEYLIKSGADINAKDYEYEYTPLLYAVNRNSSKITRILLQNGADPNKQDFFGNTALHFSIIEKNHDIFNQLTAIEPSKNIINFNLYNAEGKLPVHLAFEVDVYDFIKVLVPKSNQNIQDNNGNSSLHYLTKKDMWRKFKDDLKQLKLNVFLKNKKGKTPMDFVEDNKKEFVELITDSYIYRLRNKPYTWRTLWENMCKKEIFADKASKEELKHFEKLIKIDNDEDLCRKVIKKKILNTALEKTSETSYPVKQGYVKIDIDRDNSVEFCTFTGITLDILVGLITLLKRYNNTCSTVTSQFVENRSLCEYYKQLGVISDTKCEFLNFELIWVYQKLYLSDDFINQFKKCRDNSRIRFIVIPLGIELREGSHANYLIYDKKIDEIERFEPYGSSNPYGFNYNPYLLDSVLKHRFESEFSVKYISPIDFLPKIGFQVFDSYENQCTKIGDPKGFCALWSLWYTDMRIKYADLDRKALVKEIVKSIKEENLSFKNVIRNYSETTIKERDDILRTAGININDWLNDRYSVDQMNTVINILREKIKLLRKSFE